MSLVLLLPLATWQNFYMIIGTAAATLTGLMFVVIALVAGALRRVSSPVSGIRVFNTPNVVHFGAALFVAALLNAPWQAFWPVSLLLGLTGLAGVSSVALVLWEVRHLLADYQLVLSDWLWYVFLPLLAYLALVVAAILLPAQAVPALFITAAVTLLLLFMGIRNAWDVVTYTTIAHAQPENSAES